MYHFFITSLIAALLATWAPAPPKAEIADKPDTSTPSKWYTGNRAPLLPSPLLKLPVGSIEPRGWLGECLRRQRDGLCGQLGNISAWLQKNNNGWLSPDGKGDWGWEEVPYWLKGYGDLGYILKDPAMEAETRIWIEAVLKSQRPDGNFGPVFTDKRGVEDFWPKMIMLYCLQSWYEHTQDKRVVDLMTRFFKYQLQYPDDKFLDQYWQNKRGGDNLHSVLWLYNLTGDAWLLDLARKIHAHTADWTGEKRRDKAPLIARNLPIWWDTLPDWHNVNIAQSFREPATFYQLSHEKRHLDGTYTAFHTIRDFFGQVPGGMFGADEDARPGFDDPRQAVETCGMVEEMNSDEHLMRITADIFWADHAEEVAFNTYPASMMPDLKSLRYLTSPNMVDCDDQNHAPGIQNEGPFLLMNPFSSRCCQHNHAQGWPYYAENLWMATPDNGVAAVLYAASAVRLKVGNGAEARIEAESNYPFEEEVRFKIRIGRPTKFPFYLRIPGWCPDAAVSVNQQPVGLRPVANKFIKLTRKWADGDIVVLKLPMRVSVKVWEKMHRSASVMYGPLTFSLKIGESYVRKSSDKTAISDSKWQKNADQSAWPSFEIHPKTPWNYGLVLDPVAPEKGFTLQHRPWPADNFPFTLEAAPITLTTRAKQIPGWKLDQYGLCSPLKDSPVQTDAHEESVELVPMGAARLRISAFPVIGSGKDARAW
jgi:hypothetical protein